MGHFFKRRRRARMAIALFSNLFRAQKFHQSHKRRSRLSYFEIALVSSLLLLILPIYKTPSENAAVPVGKQKHGSTLLFTELPKIANPVGIKIFRINIFSIQTQLTTVQLKVL